MKISMYAMTVESFVPMLGNLSAILEKAASYAAAKKFDPRVLVEARLAPDMYPLARQVQIACDMAKNGVARLAGQEPPRFEDNETTIEELKARIEKTIGYVKGIPASALEGAEDRDITIPLRDRTLEMKGLTFLQKWAIPNFYFHVTTAYAILRHNGVDLGKRDYLGAV
ncbi:MAG: DUF1993 domain-containing protein [Pseudomonadota bacterium]|jgi:Uncharacterized protein conserved in bacteria|nr:MAG: DUF1993 domain-containing protein [Pseudomonadota bacterium]